MDMDIELTPPPFHVDYDLIGFTEWPFSELNTLWPYLSEQGKALLFSLGEDDLRKAAKWWGKVKLKAERAA